MRNKRINSLVYRIVKLLLAYAREFVRCNVASHPPSRLVNTQYRFYLSVTFVILLSLRFITLISMMLDANFKIAIKLLYVRYEEVITSRKKIECVLRTNLARRSRKAACLTYSKFPRGKIKPAKYECDRGTKERSDKKVNLPVLRW